ncbi:MAG: glycosyltransferase [Candidatus Cloacimonas sp.]|jgi:cellulose synthase/poly-beta-1,6-N-acetylglucosamine synthase-like glycosyltransferase|nr:glycosyltransferase [Candidatus Cloacimonas sp.]
MDKISCSIGIFAHNEADNITRLLAAVCTQALTLCEIAEIIVVSSASIDGTDDLVSAFSQQNPKVQLITQAKREGKSAAINLFMAAAKQQILVIISGDVIPAPTTIEKLVSAFSDKRLGASGGRPVPVNSDKTFMGYAVQLLWRLHHRMALLSPKLGEMIAFRKVMDGIPKDSAVDEASIEAMVRQAGLTLRYIPEAIIHNKGPENLADFIKQRRRIQNGHLWLASRQAYKVVSQDKGTLVAVLLQELRDNPFDLCKISLVVALEMLCRMLGSWDYYVRGKNPFTWDIATSTKKYKINELK